MSTLWTPDGERPVPRAAATGPAGGGEDAPPAAPGAAGPPETPDDDEVMAHLDELRQQLASAPAEAVIANHAYGLFELAAVHLSLQPPQLVQARLAIDALASLVEGLAGRLGEAEVQLSDGLAQLRMAFVQIHASVGPGDTGSEAGRAD